MNKPQNDVRISEEELYELRMKTRKVVETEFEALSDEMEHSNVYPEKMWPIAWDNGLMHLTLPKKYGGRGLCYEQYYPVLEEIGRGPSSIRMWLHVVNGLSWEIMAEHGSEELKSQVLPLMAANRPKGFFITFCLTEPDCGSGADIRTMAVRQGDNYVLNGKKTLISFTDIHDAYEIIACTDESKRNGPGFSAFYIPKDTPGIWVEPMPHMMGCRGTGHGHIIMKDCVVPAKYRFGEEGEGLTIFKQVLALSRLSIAVCQLGGCQRFLELAIARANDRVTFGKKLISRQAIQQTLADMATQVHALRLMCWDAARKADRGEDIEMESSMCKLFGIDTSRTVSDSCFEIFGGIGYFEDNPYGPVERMYRDIRGMWFEEGPRTVQRLTLVRNVIDKKGEMRSTNYF